MRKFKLRDWILVGFCVAMLSAWAYPGITQMIGGGMIGNTFSGGPVANPILLPNGSATAPSLAWGTGNKGFYTTGADDIRLTLAGSLVYEFGQTGIWIYRNDAYIAMGQSKDLYIVYDAANTLALRNGNYDQHLRISGANGTYRDEGAVSELLTIAAAASSTTTMTIPVNAVVYGVSVYVVTVIPTAATFTVIGNTSTTAFNTAAVGVAAGSSDAGTENCPYKNGAAQTIRITPNLTPAAGTGQVRITIHYYFIQVATS